MLVALLLGVLTMGQSLKPVGDLWTREPNTGTLTRTDSGFRVVHTGEQDWALNLSETFAVKPGDLLIADAPIRVVGAGSAGLSFVIRAGERTLLWTAGHRPRTGGLRTQSARAMAIVPDEATHAQVRLTGSGPAEVELTSGRYTVENLGPSSTDQAPLSLESRELRVVVEPATLRTTVTDRRNGRRWTVRPPATRFVRPRATMAKGQIRWEALGVDGLIGLTVLVELKGAELRWTVQPVAAQAPAPDLQIPGPVEASPTAEHILPVNMGLRVAANDAKFEPLWLVGYGGHGLSMAFYGQLDRGAGVLSLVGESDDFLLAMIRRDGLLQANPVWRPQMGTFGRPIRHLTQVFFGKADLNDLAQRYRAEAKRKGLLVTLAEKAKKNPNVASVARAANLWTWSDDKVGLAQAAHDAGFRNVLWSGGGSPEVLKKVAGLGFVPSRYDIYQDVMDPSRYADLPWTHPDWTAEAWPNGLVRDANGDWVRGWVVQDKQGKDVPCAVCCDLEAIAIARKRIGDELKTHPFRARFIDTTTASEYRECYDPRHPMTRSQSRDARMRLLQLVTDFGLVTGSETGHEAAVPHLVFFEGMMSLGPYRVDDAGTNPPKLYPALPDKVLTYQLGPKYRIPLWQLVYGDCTVSTWYWGDFSNKNAATWDLRDGWNMLYGTPPMYFTDPSGFAASRARFVKSYEDTQKVLRFAAMRRMTKFEDLTPDRAVQRTTWDNGLRVTANFGNRAFGGLAPNRVRVDPPGSQRSPR
ncbi:MAG: hypothetical protein KIS66_09130 [Fimbriimonadaceae bacterium]|nr:hypothetical protein [Fimbriimonadaceae bacterium]